MLRVLHLSTAQRAESFLTIHIFIPSFFYEKAVISISQLNESFDVQHWGRSTFEPYPPYGRENLRDKQLSKKWIWKQKSEQCGA